MFFFFFFPVFFWIILAKSGTALNPCCNPGSSCGCRATTVRSHGTTLALIMVHLACLLTCFLSIWLCFSFCLALSISSILFRQITSFISSGRWCFPLLFFLECLWLDSVEVFLWGFFHSIFCMKWEVKGIIIMTYSFWFDGMKKHKNVSSEIRRNRLIISHLVHEWHMLR